MNYRLGTAMFIVDVHSCNILMGKRNDPNKLCYGMLSLPGGNVDAGEDILESAVREVEEETGIVLDKNKVWPLTFTTELVTSDGSGDKYITMYYYTFVSSLIVVENREPHKCQGWKLRSPTCCILNRL